MCVSERAREAEREGGRQGGTRCPSPRMAGTSRTPSVCMCVRESESERGREGVGGPPSGQQALPLQSQCVRERKITREREKEREKESARARAFRRRVWETDRQTDKPAGTAPKPSTFNPALCTLHLKPETQPLQPQNPRQVSPVCVAWPASELVAGSAGNQSVSSAAHALLTLLTESRLQLPDC